MRRIIACVAVLCVPAGGFLLTGLTGTATAAVTPKTPPLTTPTATCGTPTPRHLPTS
ncbi:hypothetical protein ACIBBD_03780 [Streptomyces sp. NPDC051315]|uniref:hypothetical protein n=1 Tax=Streptomyces sp. NPDC051315 TaxID=3365650 RepID=UPI0037A68CBA